MGDFVGVTLRHCARRGIARVVIVGMIGKLSKMANGKMQTHAAGSEVNMELLAGFAAELGATAPVLEEIRGANTARHVLEVCAREGLTGITSLICQKVVEHGTRHAGGSVAIRAVLVDFNGAVLGEHPRQEQP
jgi:cobalt-precorrin-5B (C1)-methyltransferase